jgi:hypothetical protein
MTKQKPYIVFDPYPTIYDKHPLIAPCTKKYRVQEIAGILFAVFDNKKLYVDGAGTPQAKVRFKRHDEWNTYAVFQDGVCYLAARKPFEKIMGALEYHKRTDPKYVPNLLKEWTKSYQEAKE